MFRRIAELRRYIATTYRGLDKVERIILIASALITVFMLALPLQPNHTLLIWFGHQTESRFVPITTVLFVMIIAGTAWQIREKDKFLYGAIEIIFGIAYAYSISATMLPKGNPLIDRWGQLFACAYVIVRGLNNMKEAYVNRRKR